jgi:PEP-CTERM motif
MQGADSSDPSLRAIQGNYSIFMQGGIFAANTNGATISQAGVIPIAVQTLIYWGSALQVLVDGQRLSFTAISNAPNYTVWGANISAYAGQGVQLSFTAPWQTSGLLDNLQFSSAPIPEPSALALAALGGLLFGFRRWKS